VGRDAPELVRNGWSTDTLKLKQAYPTEEEIDRLIDAREYDEIEWDDKPED
jgi:hypothetical protein